MQRIIGGDLIVTLQVRLYGTVDYSNWLYMTITVNPSTIINGSTANVTVSFNNIYNGTTVNQY